MNQVLVATIVLAVVSIVGAAPYFHSATSIANQNVNYQSDHSVHEEEEEPHHHKPMDYSYKYEVTDFHTGDIKSQHETRKGGVVVGQYSVAEPDGTLRIVEYSAHPHTGFVAKVYRSGHGTQQPEQQQADRVTHQQVQVPYVHDSNIEEHEHYSSANQ